MVTPHFGEETDLTHYPKPIHGRPPCYDSLDDYRTNPRSPCRRARPPQQGNRSSSRTDEAPGSPPENPSFNYHHRSVPDWVKPKSALVAPKKHGRRLSAAQ